MANQVESWFQAVTSITDSGQDGDIISPIDFVPPSMLSAGSERDVALHASKTMAPRADVIAAAIAAGQATVKTTRINQATMSGEKIEEKKSLSSAPPQRQGFLPSLPAIFFPRQQKFQPIMMQQYMRIMRIAVLTLMICCGILVTYTTLERLLGPSNHQGGSTLAKLHHHTKNVISIVRGKGALTDKHNKCPEWVSLGGCVSNPVFMRESCTKSCSLRSLDTSGIHLVDQNNYCGQWAARGECLNNPKFMMMECAKSCSELEKNMENKEASLDSSLASSLPSVPTESVKDENNKDKSEYCQEWASAGECQANAAFMIQECPKSCGAR